MKYLKKSLAILLCLMCALSGCVFSASAAEAEPAPVGSESTTIYFEVPENWTNYSKIFCYIEDSSGYPLFNWQSKKGGCTDEGNGIFSYDTTKAGGIREGETYSVIMSANTGPQTFPTVLDLSVMGDTIYCDGSILPNPLDSNKQAYSARWKNNTQYGPICQITDIGEVVGETYVKTPEEMFTHFLNNTLSYTRTFSGKTDQQIIDDIISALDISTDIAEELILSSGVSDLDWDPTGSSDRAPIEKIVVSPVTLIENLDGRYQCDSELGIVTSPEYFVYSIPNVEFTVYFKDGTSQKSTNGIIESEDEFYSSYYEYNQSFDNQWSVGNTYEGTLYVMDEAVPFSITIVESPIKNLELITPPKKTVFDKLEHITPEGAVFRLNYKDGTYQDITPGLFNPHIRNTIFIDRFNKEFSWSLSAIDENNKYEFLFMNMAVELDGSCNSTEPSDLLIREEGDKLYAEITYADGTKKSMEVLGCDGRIIITDNGSYSGTFLEDTENGGHYLSIIGGKYTFLNSNTLNPCNWWLLREKFNTLAYSLAIYAQDTKRFNGEVTKENIDNLLNIVCHYDNLFYDDDSFISGDEDYVELKADKVSDAFSNLFGITPDLTLSRNYDPEANSVKVTQIGSGGPGFDPSYEVTHKNDLYTAVINWGVRKFTITLNESYNLTHFNIQSNAGILGDSNLDGKVNVKDATLIQKHTANIETLSANALSLADVNADTKVNVKDATAIQKYVANMDIDFPIGESV